MLGRAANKSWFETLEALGDDKPFSQAIPVEYETGEWRFNLNLT